MEDLVIVDLLYRNQPVWGSLRSRLSALEELGVVERIGEAVVSGTCCRRGSIARSAARAPILAARA